MKKVIVVAFVLFSMTSFGQKNKKGDLEFGVNLGFNSSTVMTSNGNSDGSTGINVGLAADYFFSNRWSVKGKMIYDQKGWDNGFFNNLDTGYTYTTDYNLNYLTIPVMANWHFGRKRNWYLNFGPYAGFLLGANETTNNRNVKEAFNTTDFGISFGIGVKIPVSDQLKISLEYDEQDGFLDVFKVNSGLEAKNSRGSFNIGVNFLLQ
jgi:opacity protein-like surface antigen